MIVLISFFLQKITIFLVKYSLLNILLFVFVLYLSVLVFTLEMLLCFGAM